MLQLLYEGTDMTDFVNVTACAHRESAMERADSLEVTFDHAAAWHRWGPQADDEIEARLDGYSTGRLYLNSLLPEGDGFRMIATSLPGAARTRSWAGYRDMRFSQIMHLAASECGLKDGLYGLDGDWRYRFLLRRNDGAAAFAARIGRWEGLAVRALNGALRAISIPWAQERETAQSLEIDAEQAGVRYVTDETARLSAIEVVSASATATARDTARGGRPRRVVALPAEDAAQAGRWARGLLLMNNRRCERLEVDSVFNPGMTPLIGVAVAGSSAASGEWLVEEVEHDLVNGATHTEMFRRVVTIA